MSRLTVMAMIFCSSRVLLVGLPEVMADDWSKKTIVPLQDVLGLGSNARMNLPGTVTGNWKWRYRPAALSSGLCARLRSLVTLYDR